MRLIGQYNWHTLSINYGAKIICHRHLWKAYVRLPQWVGIFCLPYTITWTMWIYQRNSSICGLRTGYGTTVPQETWLKSYQMIFNGSYNVDIMETSLKLFHRAYYVPELIHHIYIQPPHLSVSGTTVQKEQYGIYGGTFRSPKAYGQKLILSSQNFSMNISNLAIRSCSWTRIKRPK